MATDVHLISIGEYMRVDKGVQPFLSFHFMPLILDSDRNQNHIVFIIGPTRFGHIEYML